MKKYPALVLFCLFMFFSMKTYVSYSQNSTIETDAPVLTIVEKMPIFPGGPEALYKYIANTVVYPTVAKDSSITGTVIVTFIVERDGSVTNVKILKGIGGGCDEEALRVVKAMPKWSPGKQDGKPVRVQFNLPIRFSLE